MKLTVSAPTQLALVAALVCTAIAVLRPEAVELPGLAAVSARQENARGDTKQNRIEGDKLPWERSVLPEPETPKDSLEGTAGVPPLPAQMHATSDADHVPPLPAAGPASPTAQEHPEIAYLGRIVSDEKTQVFLAVHGETLVFRQGDVVDGVWLVQSVSSSELILRHVNTGETRVVSTGASTNGHSMDVKTVQVGPRFLATNTDQSQPAN